MRVIANALCLFVLVLLCIALPTNGQNITLSSPSPSHTLTHANATLTNLTATQPPSTSTVSTSLPASNVTSANATPTTASWDNDVLPLKTIIDPAFGITGAILILTGLPLAFIGDQSTWYTCATTGFYSMQLIVIAFILRFGQARAVFDPSTTVRGLFLLACLCAGLIGAILSLVFRQGAKLACNALGGLALAFVLQACRPGGLIRDEGARYILFIGWLSAFFILACVPRIQQFTLIFSTAIVGSTASVLGIDCFTRVNLKEFYIRNLGFDDLFLRRYPQAFAQHRWPISTGMIIELGVIVGVTCMSIAVQSKTWFQRQKRLSLMREQDAEVQREQDARESVSKSVFALAQHELRLWKGKHGEKDDAETATMATTSPSILMYKDTPTPETPPPQIDLYTAPVESNLLSPAVAASMGIDMEIQPSIPSPGFKAPGVRQDGEQVDVQEEINDKVKLLDEIAAIRKSIGELRTGSFSSHATLDSNMGKALLTAPVPASCPATIKGDVRRSSSPWLLNSQVDERCERTDSSNELIWKQDSSSEKRSSSPHAMRSNSEEQYDRRPKSALPNDFHPRQSTVRPTSLIWPTTTQQPAPKDGRARPSSFTLQDHPFPERTVVGTPTLPLYTANPLNTATMHRSKRPSTSRLSMLTGNELQARHNARLSKMQRPLSMQLNEAAALEQAKEDWQRRKQEERRHWHDKHRHRS